MAGWPKPPSGPRADRRSGRRGLPTSRSHLSAQRAARRDRRGGDRPPRPVPRPSGRLPGRGSLGGRPRVVLARPPPACPALLARHLRQACPSPTSISSGSSGSMGNKALASNRKKLSIRLRFDQPSTTETPHQGAHPDRSAPGRSPALPVPPTRSGPDRRACDRPPACLDTCRRLARGLPESGPPPRQPGA